MTEELYLKSIIKDNFDQVKILRAQPIVDAAAIDDVLWRVLGLALQLNDLYAKQIKEIDSREVVTIKEELFKRQEIAELSNRKEDAVMSLFDRNDIDQNKVRDLFEDMRYETTFYESDVKLVQEQLDAVKEADEKVAELTAERQETENRIQAIKDSMESFEQFNGKLNEDYERVINEAHIKDINVEEAMIERARRLERQAVIVKNRQLLKTAQNIDVNEYSYVSFLSENEIALHAANEKLFLYEMGNLCSAEVHSYEELYDKTKKIHEYVSDREASSAQIYNVDRPNEISYRTIAFAMDVHSVENQIKAPSRIAELEEKLHQINLDIEHAHDQVKGRKLLDDIINNRKEEYPKSGIAQEVQIPNDVEPINVAPIVNKVEPIVSTPIINKNEPLIATPINKGNIVPNDVEKALVPVGPTALVPLIEGEFEVIKQETAKPSLLARIKAKYKDILITIGKVAVTVMLVGSLIGLASLYIEKNKQQAPVIANPTPIEQTVDLGINVTNPQLDEIIDQAVETYSPTIGDKVHVGEGIKYYRDSSVAQLGQGSYETGKSGLKEGDYNVNRIALLAKDASGQPTGKIIDVNTTPGVSAKELATSLGLPEGNYDVIMHIGSGDGAGNYLEANKDAQSPDDLCWIKTDGAYVNGLALTKSAAEVLNINAERGMGK